MNLINTMMERAPLSYQEKLVFETGAAEIISTYNLLKTEVFDPAGIKVPEIHEVRVVSRHRKSSGRNIANVRRNFSVRRLVNGSTRRDIHYSRVKRDRGKLYRLTFNWQYWYSWANFVGTLAHEMIHLHQAIEDKPLAHDRYFHVIGTIIQSKLGSYKLYDNVGRSMSSFSRPYQHIINTAKAAARQKRMIDFMTNAVLYG